MSNVTIEKMEKQELLKEYDQCVQALAREAVDKGTINPSLWDRIAKIQSALRECDVLEEIKRQLDYKNKRFMEIPISKENYFKQISKDSINLLPRKELYNNILKRSTEAAEYIQNQAAQSMDLIKQSSLPYIEMTSPMAAEMVQDAAAQPDYFGESRPR